VADVQAGDLFVEIKGSTAGASRSLNNIIKKLGVLNSSLKAIDTTNLSKMTSELNGASGGAKGGGSKSKSSSSKRGGGFGIINLARWSATIFLAKRLGNAVANIGQHGADYTETLNLWETAMGSNINLATEFIDKMNKAYGISEKTLMNAQAIFKNMIGSLGQISDQMAYSLSEGITQMAIDYASLYNVTFEQAFSKFQAVLAGQVRPIRSVAGYDITETTLFQLYQSLGGQKTMRQLTRTEKQLLSILAIFHQMERSGATGDLAKTMESYANQTRVMAEAWKQVTAYAGTLITYLIQQSGILVKINGLLIFLGNTLKSLANDMGAIQHFGGNIFEDVTDGANDASLALDEVNGKLLDFDKFRALSSSQDNNIGLDETLLNSLTKFESILSSVDSEAQKFAERLTEIYNNSVIKEIFESIFSDNSAKTIIKQLLNTILSALKIILPILLEITVAFSEIGEQLLPIVTTFIEEIADALVPLLKMMKLSLDTSSKGGKNILNIFETLLNILSVLEPIFDIIYAISWVVSVIANGIIYVVEVILTPFVWVLEFILKIIETIADTIHALFTWDWEGLGKKLGKLWSNWNTGKYMENLNRDIVPKYADGGLPDKGTMFIAGEAGAEIVYNTPSGQAGVANIQQIKQAQLQAMHEWWSSAKYDIPQFQGVSESGLYEVIDGEAHRRGKTFANV
jgi:hypothetical protein